MTKTKVIEASVSWTADHAQYFQGHGVALTDYDSCATGCGETLREAFEDALEQLAEQDIEWTSVQEQELLADLADQLNKSYDEPLDATVVDLYCDANGKHTIDEEGVTVVDEDPDCSVCAREWHFYVSVDVKFEEVANEY